MKYLDSGDLTTRNELRQVLFFLDHVEANDFVLDIGAHVGQYAVLFGALVGERGRVISFEPDRSVHATLRRNIELNGFEQRVTVEAVALSDTNGSAEFFSLGGNSMSSLVRSGLGSAADSASVSKSAVTTMRLDDLLESRSLPCPRWMKIDTEGAEVHVLRGAPKALKSVEGILCELHPYAWNDFGSTYDELLSIVRDSGRTISWLDGNRRIEDGPAYGTVIIT